MTEQTEKKGLSTGCLIGLIVTGVILVMIIAIAVTCYVKRDELAKFGLVTIMNASKDMVAKESTGGIDTVRFNTSVDVFLKKFNDEPLDAQKYAAFFQTIRTMPDDQRIDSAETETIIKAIVQYYPELEEMIPPPVVIDSALYEDSSEIEQ